MTISIDNYLHNIKSKCQCECSVQFKFNIPSYLCQFRLFLLVIQKGLQVVELLYDTPQALPTLHGLYAGDDQTLLYH